MRRSTAAEAGLSVATPAVMRSISRLAKLQLVSRPAASVATPWPQYFCADPITEATGARGAVDGDADAADQDFLVFLLAGDGELTGGAGGEILVDDSIQSVGQFAAVRESAPAPASWRCRSC